MAENETETGADQILIHVGDNVDLSEETVDALNQLAASLHEEYGDGDDVSGFMFDPMSVASPDSFDESDFSLEGMMPGGMGGGMGSGMGGTVSVCTGAFRIKINT